jgi:hypothetical protein
MRRLALAAPLLATSVLIACSAPEPDVRWHDVGTAELPIINGYPDTTHQAVVAVLANQSACSGTIVAVEGNSAFVLTAGHCVTDAPQYIIQDNDYSCYSNMTCDGVYIPQNWQAHPNYNGQVYDFAMIQANGASASTPIIPAASSDALAHGTAIKHVGYGTTNPPNGENSRRNYFDGSVDEADAYGDGLVFTYDESQGGTCFGDSGGPQLSSGTEKVVGVSSAVGDDYCSTYGLSGRVSRVYSWIQGFITGAGGGTAMNCDQCFSWSTSGQGPCMGAVNACVNNTECNAIMDCLNGCTTYACQQSCFTQHPSGQALYDAIFTCVCQTGCPTECGNNLMCHGGAGGSGAGGSGTGGSGTGGSGTGNTGNSGTGNSGTGASGASVPDDGWVAGDTPEKHYDGEYVGSCAVGRSAGATGGAWMWLWAAAAGLGVAARRRRRG